MNESPHSNVAVTENGLVVKNVAKIEQIHSRMECRIEAQMASWQVCRILRRDFPLVSAKMFKTCCNKSGRARIQDLLLELALQSQEMKSHSQAYDDSGEPAMTSVPIRIVSPETAMLYQSLKQADEVYARLNWAHVQSRLTERGRSEIARGFEVAYGDLKRLLFGNRGSTKTASEMGKELGIG